MKPSLLFKIQPIFPSSKPYITAWPSNTITLTVTVPFVSLNGLNVATAAVHPEVSQDAINSETVLSSSGPSRPDRLPTINYMKVVRFLLYAL